MRSERDRRVARVAAGCAPARGAGRADRCRARDRGAAGSSSGSPASTRCEEKDLRPHIALTARGGNVGIRRALSASFRSSPTVGDHPFRPHRAAARRGPAPERLHPQRLARTPRWTTTSSTSQGRSGRRRLRHRGGPAAPAARGAFHRPGQRVRRRSTPSCSRTVEPLRAGGAGRARPIRRRRAARTSPTAPRAGSGTAAIRSRRRRPTRWWTPRRTGPTWWSGCSPGLRARIREFAVSGNETVPRRPFHAAAAARARRLVQRGRAGAGTGPAHPAPHRAARADQRAPGERRRLQRRRAARE